MFMFQHTYHAQCLVSFCCVVGRIFLLTTAIVLETNEIVFLFSYFKYAYRMYKKERASRENTSIKVGHSSNFLFQGFAEKYFLGIYLHSKA